MKTLRHFVALALAILLAGCIRQWSLEIERWDAAAGPIFCLGESGQCGKQGVQMHFISVSQESIDGSPGKIVWQLQNVTDKDGQATLRSLVYGVIPEGWAEVVKAEPLLPNVFYSINEEYYFKRDMNYKYSVLPRDVYFSQRRATSAPK